MPPELAVVKEVEPSTGLAGPAVATQVIYPIICRCARALVYGNPLASSGQAFWPAKVYYLVTASTETESDSTQVGLGLTLLVALIWKV